jgi:hypothetical protein
MNNKFKFKQAAQILGKKQAQYVLRRAAQKAANLIGQYVTDEDWVKLTHATMGVIDPIVRHTGSARHRANQKAVHLLVSCINLG